MRCLFAFAAFLQWEQLKTFRWLFQTAIVLLANDCKNIANIQEFRKSLLQHNRAIDIPPNYESRSTIHWKRRLVRKIGQCFLSPLTRKAVLHLQFFFARMNKINMDTNIQSIALRAVLTIQGNNDWLLDIGFQNSKISRLEQVTIV